MKKSFSLKDHLFNPKKIGKLADSIAYVYSDFEQEAFEKSVLEKFPKLELKQRIVWISNNLTRYLPEDFREAVTILLDSLPPENDPQKTDNDFGDFIFSSYAEFVVQNGLEQENVLFSLGALKEMTKRFSVEDAIRSLINAFPEETIAALEEWSKDSHYHVRRLVSEGTRPKLPWSQKITLDYTQGIQLLDILFKDNTRFVTRSVSNHLNDISKFDSEIVLKYLKKWKASNDQKESEMTYIINHSLRTLVKKGDAQTMEFLGFSSNPNIQVLNLSIKSEYIRIGDPLLFSFKIVANEDEDVIIDYVMHFQKKTSGLGKKVYKIKKLCLRKDQQEIINKKHLLRKNMSTRTLYEGEHALEIQVNGRVFAKKKFFLVA